MELKLYLLDSVDGIKSEEVMEFSEDVVLKMTKDQLWRNFQIIQERLRGHRQEFIDNQKSKFK